ncbi:MAG: glycosyltransferase family 9 protein [Bacteroidetes bacterium]|nr:glycosyltransferase family 9 protein [Bacteroidota bacterium]
MKILLIQTAFIGDVVLATSLIEKLHQHYPGAQIHFLLRKGNEGLLVNHPILKKVLVWDKKQSKYKNLFGLLSTIRKEKYDVVINCHRFGASGFLAGFSGAKQIIGFKKNPFSFLFTKKFSHHLGAKGDEVYPHEIERNHFLILKLTDWEVAPPKFYPSPNDFEEIKKYTGKPYITISPASVWFTKQYPKEKWIDFVNQIPQDFSIYLLGGGGDKTLCEEIIKTSSNKNIINLAGQLSYLQSATLIQSAKMNYTNDSAPLHFASAMGATVTAVFCSTIPEFGFGPLKLTDNIIQTAINLECRPCGLHGKKACPLGHFKCALTIETSELLKTLD